jgi:hypothetical protein
MVGCGRHTADTVVTGRQTAVNLGGEETLAVTSIVDTLEEGKLLRVQRLSRVQTIASVLNSDVGMADDVTTTVEVLRSRIVGGCCISERARCKVDKLHGDIKVLIGFNVVTVLRRCED